MRAIQTIDHTWRLLCVVAFVGLFACAGCVAMRPDDSLEPNNTTDQATALKLGTTIKARANQGNPDIFKIEVAEGLTLTFELESLGLEDCPAFTFTGPGDHVLYADARARCRRVGDPAVHEAGVEFEIIKGYGYRLRTKTKTAGIYYLTIIEGSDADNIAPYSWDYRLTATVE